MVSAVIGAGALLFGIDAFAEQSKPAVPASQASLSAAKPRTLLEVRRPIWTFAQDRDRIAWATTSKRCSRGLVLLRRLSTRKTTSLACVGGDIGYVQQPMALAGTRAIWAHATASNSAFHFTLFTAATGHRPRELGSMHTERDVESPGEGFRPIPMAGDGATLAFADISDAEERHADGVYRVGRNVKHLPMTEGTFALAVSGGRVAIVRDVAPGCVCNRDAQWSPDGRTIFFSSTAGAEGGFRNLALYSMNGDGTRLRRLTSSVLGDFSLSPNGRSLLYGRSRQIGLGDSRSEIFVASSDGTRARRLVRGGTAAWSPDSRSVAYDHYARYGPYGPSGDEYVSVVPARGGTARRITRGSGPVWSPDGRKVAFVRGDGLYVVDVARRSVRRIFFRSGSSITDYEWSPDGRNIAFVRQGLGLYVADVARRSVRRISRSPIDIGDYEWSPDGTRIAFTLSDDLARYELHSVGRDGTGDLKIADGASYASGIAWSPDSSTIAFTGFRVGRETIELVSAAGGNPRELALGSDPDWSPDGRSLVYLAASQAAPDGRVGYEIARIASDGSAGQVLTSTHPAPGGSAVEVRVARSGKALARFNTTDRPRAVALSGSRVALLFRTESGQRIEIRALGGSVIRTIDVAPGVGAIGQIFMSRRWLVFGSGAAIRAVDVQTGMQAVLARTRGLVDLSVDGRRVAWAEQRGRKSWIRALVLP